MPFHELPFKLPIPAPDVIDEVVVAAMCDTEGPHGTHQEMASDNSDATGSPKIIVFGESARSSTSINAIAAFEPSEDIIALQHECPDFKDILCFLETQELPSNDILARKITFQADQFCLDNGILYHLTDVRNKKPDTSNPVLKQLCLPKCTRERFVQKHHDELAHPGFHKLYETIREKVWWPLLYTSLYEYVGTCSTCQMAKRPVGLKHAPLQPLSVLNPFEIWVTDILGPLIPDPHGNKYILVCCDSLSSWPECFPMKSCDAETTAETLFSIVFCRFGMPSYLISDRGPNYTSRLMQALCKLCHIQQSFSTAYHHETAGRAEQFISSILKTFRMYCNSNNDWSSKIDAVLLSYRALKTTITNLSPRFCFLSKCVYQLIRQC